MAAFLLKSDVKIASRTLNMEVSVEYICSIVRDSVDRTVLFWLYGKTFRVSHIEDNEETWVDIQEIGHSTKVRVRNEEQLVTYIRNHVATSPVHDDVIMFNVKNAVCNYSHLRCGSEE